MRHSIIIDTDPGQDDAIAILLALGSEKLDLKALTVTSGNVGLDACVNNALRILELAGRDDIPVYAGAERPLVNAPIHLEDVFGADGLAGGERLPKPKKPAQPLHAADALASFYASPSDTLLAPIAPMTNIALALKKNPALAHNIPGLIVMGGCPYPEPVRGEMGNISIHGGPYKAEYNFATDPHAAAIVLQSGIKNISLVGLNVTRAVLYNMDMDVRLRHIGSPAAIAIADILSTIGEDDVRDYGHLRQTPSDPVRAVHDAVALASAEDPSIFTWEDLPLDIPDEGPHAGQTIISKDGVPVRVAVACNASRFMALLLHNIARL